jgi:hypothetical protein
MMVGSSALCAGYSLTSKIRLGALGGAPAVVALEGCTATAAGLTSGMRERRVMGAVAGVCVLPACGAADAGTGAADAGTSAASGTGAVLSSAAGSLALSSASTFDAVPASAVGSCDGE